MRSIVGFAVLCTLPGAALGYLDRRASGALTGSNGYIVEFAQSNAKLRGRQSLQSEGVEIIKTFESEVFSGAAVETTEQTADELLSLPEVARVWRNNLVQLDPGNLTSSFSDDANSANYSSHHLTKVNGLHDRGLFGEGVKVGIVDTGILYTHPALGGGIGDGFKIAGGYDFVGDGNWPEDGEEKAPDEDPVDYRGHGTHVAGIVAGFSDRFTGVAPKATLYAYKVFSNSGYTDDATLIEAFLRAYDDGVDIITASIGGTNGWQDNAWAVVASRLVDQGIVVTIAAGNSGDAGPFYGSSGSSGKNVLAVASTANELAPATSFRVNFSTNSTKDTSIVGYIPSVFEFDSTIVDWPMVPLGLDTNATNEACEPYPEGFYNLTGKVALVRRGGCTAMEKQANLEALGAQWIIIYNNEQPLVQLYQETYQSLMALIEDYSGEAIVKAVAAGQKVTVDFSKTNEEIVGLPWAYAGKASYWTSWGGLNELEFKPDVAAPGGEIFSTYIDNRFATLSGTSMATPYVAGVAALYIGLYGGRSVHGPEFAKALGRRIIASGNNVAWWDPEIDANAPPPQVGTGLIDAFKVINYTTSLDFQPIALNDTANFVSTHEIVIRNDADEDVTYEFSVEAAKGMDIFFPADGSIDSPRIKTLYDLELVDMPVNVNLPESVTLKPGESKAVSVVFEKPTFEGFAIPLYSGKILIESSMKESLSVPYMGIGSDLKEEMSDMYMAKFPEGRLTLNWSLIEDNPSWSNNVWGVGEDWLWTTVQIRWASRQMRWDIYEPGWNESQWSYPPKVGENGYLGSVAYWKYSGERTWSQFSYDADPTDSLSFPMYDLNRNAVYGQYRYTFLWFGMLGNGSQIEPGNYKMRLGTLKPFGIPEESSDWSVWDVPEISITGKFGPNPWGQ